MFDRTCAGWNLSKQSWQVLKLDKELILFPIMGGIGVLILIGLFFAIGKATGTIDHFEEPTIFNPQTGLEENQIPAVDIL